MIRRDVKFGKGKIKGIASFSRKYWDDGKLTTNADKIILKGKKTSFELATKDIKDVEFAKHRTVKILKITMQNGDYYFISSIPDKISTLGIDMQEFADIWADAERKNERLYTALQEFLNP
ncbi:MAG: hypothetical protein ACFE96_18995 [Candidatus Hermodarchaeota archaeon]